MREDGALPVTCVEPREEGGAVVAGAELGRVGVGRNGVRERVVGGLLAGSYRRNNSRLLHRRAFVLCEEVGGGVV